MIMEPSNYIIETQSYLLPNQTSSFDSNMPSNKSHSTVGCHNEDPKSVNTLIGLTNQILLVYPWVMITIGTCSNLISFIVLTRPKLKKSSTFFYLSCLCVIDLITLHTFCINFIFLYQFGIDLQLMNPAFCRIYSFLIYFLPQFSGWTVAAVSLDRVVAISFSLRGRHAVRCRRWTTPKRAAKVMLFIFTVLLLLNMQFFFYPNEYEFTDTKSIQDINIIYCSPENIPRFTGFYEVWVNIDLLVNVLIPFAIMIISSLIIIVSLLKSTNNLGTNSLNKRQAKKVLIISQHDKADTNDTNTSDCTLQTSDQLMKKTKAKNRSLVLKARISSQLSVSSKAKNVSAMLATNNFLFFSLTLPIVVFLSTVPAFSEIECDYEKAKVRLIKTVCIILMNSNCTINIFIYIFMSSQFKHELVSLFAKLSWFKK